MTDASAEVLSGLPEDKRRAIMAELFGRGKWRARPLVHAPDRSARPTFRRAITATTTRPGTFPIPSFAISRSSPRRSIVLPRVREALAINPDLLVMISPWSAPAWMKTTQEPHQGASSCRNIIRPSQIISPGPVQAFGQEGVPVSMLTIQNEPNFEPDNYPGERVDPTAASRDHRPLCRPDVQVAAGFTPRSSTGITIGIIPRCRSQCSPIRSHGNISRASPGIATKATLPAQSPVHDAFPRKDAWLTECSGGEWSRSLPRCSPG